MPSATLLPEEKAIIRKVIGHECQIFTATVCRLYLAKPDPSRWTYANITGAIAFMKDLRRNNSFFFRLVDLKKEVVVFEQELYNGFQYYQDRPFLHSFATDYCMAAFSFADQNEAAALYNKVINRDNLRVQPKGSSRPTSMAGPTTVSPRPTSIQADPAPLAALSISGGGKKTKGKIDKSKIGLPTNFRHLTHIGWDPEKGFSTVNIPPEWKKVFERAGVTEEQLQDTKTAKFIYDFMTQHADTGDAGGAPPAALASHNTPPPPPGRGDDIGSAPSRRVPPPPPPTRRGPAPPPPPMPSRGAAPPPPPVPPMSTGGPPPPAPPPMAAPMAAAARPPPAAPRGVPPPKDGRNALLESIRGAGGIGGLKPVADRDGSGSERSSTNDLSTSGGDIASALRNALATRQTAMHAGYTDDEEEDGDEDEW